MFQETLYGNIALNKPTFLDIDKVVFSSCGISYRNTSDMLLKVANFNKVLLVCMNWLHIMFIVFCELPPIYFKVACFEPLYRYTPVFVTKTETNVMTIRNVWF